MWIERRFWTEGMADLIRSHQPTNVRFILIHIQRHFRRRHFQRYGKLTFLEYKSNPPKMGGLLRRVSFYWSNATESEVVVKETGIWIWSILFFLESGHNLKDLPWMKTNGPESRRLECEASKFPTGDNSGSSGVGLFSGAILLPQNPPLFFLFFSPQIIVTPHLASRNTPRSSEFTISSSPPKIHSQNGNELNHLFRLDIKSNATSFMTMIDLNWPYSSITATN